jgi:hypothetical protein
VQDESPAAMQHQEGPPRFDGTPCDLSCPTWHSAEVRMSRHPSPHFSSSRDLMGSCELTTAGFEHRMVNLKDLGATTGRSLSYSFAFVHCAHDALMTCLLAHVCVCLRAKVRSAT